MGLEFHYLFCFSFYEVITISYHGSRVNRVNSGLLRFFPQSFIFWNWFYFSFLSFGFRLLGLEFHDFFFCFPFYGVVPIFYLGLWVNRVNRGWLEFLMFFLTDFLSISSFNIRLLPLEFHDFIYFFFVGLSLSYILSCWAVHITWVDLCFINFFT